MMLTLLYFSSLVIYGMVRTIFRDVFTGIGAEVTEQVEFGCIQNLNKMNENGAYKKQLVFCSLYLNRIKNSGFYTFILVRVAVRGKHQIL
jgi:hypothetical protein